MSSSRSATRRPAGSQRARSNGAGSKQQSRPAAPAPRALDGAAVARGAGTAFTILVLGGILTPLIGHFLGNTPLRPVAVAWLVIVGAVGYLAGGFRARTLVRPWLHGILAALGGCVLTLPLILFGELHQHLATSTILEAIGIDLGVAVVVGAVGGLIGAYWRGRRGGEQRQAG